MKRRNFLGALAATIVASVVKKEPEAIDFTEIYISKLDLPSERMWFVEDETHVRLVKFPRSHMKSYTIFHKTVLDNK